MMLACDIYRSNLDKSPCILRWFLHQCIYYLSFSLFFVVLFLVDRSEGRFMNSNSDVTDTEDLALKPLLERGDINVTFKGILKLQCF